MNRQSGFVRPCGVDPPREEERPPSRNRVDRHTFRKILEESPTYRELAQGRRLTGLSALYERSKLRPGFSLGGGVGYVQLDFDDPHV